VATLVEFFGAKKTDQLTVGDVDAYKRHRMRTIGATSINNELRVLRAILNWARAAGHLVPELKWKQLPVRGQGRVQVWSEPEVQAIYTACRNKAPALLPLLVFMMNTGVRKGECIAAEWSWMDFEAGLIRIPSNEFWQPKNGKPREVPMSDVVRAILSGERKSARWVFPNRKKQRFKDFPKDVWLRMIRSTKLKGHPHTCRHTFASHFLAKVPDMQLLAEILGHSTTRVTELYTHLLPGRLDRAKNAVCP
jgi:integrase